MSNKLYPVSRILQDRMQPSEVAACPTGASERCSVALRALAHHSAGAAEQTESEDDRQARIEFLRASIRARTYNIPSEQIAEAMLNLAVDIWR